MCCKDGQTLLNCIVDYMEAELMLRSVTTITTPNLRGLMCSVLCIGIETIICVLGFMEPIK